MKLDTPLSEVKSIGPIYLKRLEKLGLTTVHDFLNHVPHRYDDYSLLSNTQKAQVGEVITIHGEIASLKNVFTKRGLRMQIGAIKDSQGRLPVIWFNQPFLTKMFFPGRKVSLSGKVQAFSGKPAMVSPEYEILDEEENTIHTGGIIPIYPETLGLSSKWIRSKMRLILEQAEDSLKEFLPNEDLKKYYLEDIKKSYKLVHLPTKLEEEEKAKKSLAFNKLLFLHLQSLSKKSSSLKANLFLAFST